MYPVIVRFMRYSGGKMAAAGFAALVVFGVTGASALPPDPPANVAPSPDFNASCAAGPGVNDNSQACLAAALQAIDNARAKEGVGAMVLPTHFSTLSPDQQLFVLVNRERVDRGLPPFTGLVDELNAAAVQGAQRAGDPSVNQPSYAGSGWFGTSDYAGSQPSSLAADYFWVYLDGWGGSPANTPNIDCTGATASGCWSHRNGILGAFNSLPNLTLGAAFDATSSNGHQAWTLLLIGTEGQAPGYTYAWASALADTPGPGTGCGSAPAPPAPTGKVTRVAGDGRDQTAIAISQRSFPNPGSASAVVVAQDADFPDALAGGPLAVVRGGPLLITPKAALPDIVRAEIKRVLPAQQTVYVLGGTFALSSSIDDALTADGYTVTRIAGASRFETAVKIADALGDPSTVFEATGNGFADALAAGPPAAANHGVILLTQDAQQSDATAAYLSAHPGSHFAIGGPATAADPSAASIAGSDRYATAVKVTTAFFPTPKALGFATGADFPDALAGGPATARAGGGLILVPKCPPVPASVTNYLQSVTPSVTSGSLYGGSFVVTDDTLTQIEQSLGS